MRFGLFYEHQMPRPWGEDAEEKLLSDALDQVELADRSGFDYAWEVEHHFLEEYSHSSAPEVFLAAASQRTEQIRLGHGIVQLPSAFNHPARTAERVATLDLVSGGRVDFGTGEGSSQLELGGFGIQREDKHAAWEEGLDTVTRMMVEEPFAGYEGRWLSMPPRNVVPKPKQKPHPPLWVACSRRETILVAARKGIGALTFAFVEPEQAAEWVEEYYELIASDECVPAGFSVNPNFAVVLPLMCHPVEETAIERGIDGAHFFGYSLAYYYAFGKHVPGVSDVHRDFVERRGDMGFAREIVTPDDAPLGVKLLQEGLGSLRGAIGTPEQIRDLVRRYEKAGVDQIIFVGQAGDNRHEHICESIELFASEVLPEFADGRERRDAEKAERLGDLEARALARRPPARSADSAYTVTPKGEPRPAELIAAASRAPRNGSGPRGLRERLEEVGQAAFTALVSRRSDRQLQRLFGNRPALRTIFRGMERAFVPEQARGFSGEIEYEINGAGDVHRWVVTIDGDRAATREGAAVDPAVKIRASVPNFLRLAADDESAPRLLLEGGIEIEGDMQVAARLGEMFGAEGLY